MAKHKVGVLEASVSPESSAPAVFCGRAIAEHLIGEGDAHKLGKRLIQMVRGKAREAVRLAKAARDAALKRLEAAKKRRGFTDGMLGVGNMVPFTKRTDGQPHHYEIPHAGDVGLWRHFRKKIQVSARSRFQPPSASYCGDNNPAPSLADAFPV